MFYLGLGKTLFNSSACVLKRLPTGLDIELVLSERILRKKAVGVWPEAAIRLLEPSWGESPLIADNRDVSHPDMQEASLDRKFPFYDYLQNKGLAKYTRHFNPEVKFITHHLCHAMAAVAMSPYEKCLIFVMDGAGSKLIDFPLDSKERMNTEGVDPDSHEECTVYLHNKGSLECVHKRWRLFRSSTHNPERIYSEGIGIVYETIAEYIFNSKRAAGKVMGLAAFGKAKPMKNRWNYLEELDWTQAFTGKSKQEWEASGKIPFYADIAATVQQAFEEDVFASMEMLRQKFPDYTNLILTGGCALNCTTNMKLSQKALFHSIYVPPFPGDESIAFGAASALYHKENLWQPLLHGRQHGYFGPKSSVPEEKEITALFSDFSIEKPISITAHVADLLSRGEILAWFQGRSESGPRALGNRSILASPLVKDLKMRLNRDIKFRESFRPYGASCPQELASSYFLVPEGFDSPYMSFAVKPRPEFCESLKEVCHVDGTSRIQTVRVGQNARFHELLHVFGKKMGVSCLLNTSLNIMGEPIIETAADAKKFLESAPVHGLAIGDFYIRRKR